MLRFVATSVVLAAVGGLLASPPAQVNAPQPPDINEFLRQAILNGLADDGVAPALAAELGKREDYVPKCSICEPTRKALQDYGKLNKQAVAKVGKGLSEGLTKRLKSDTNETRRTALRELVQRYIEHEYARRELTVEQKTALQAKMEEMRKAAMGALPRGQKFCPSCDGACRLTPKL